MTALTGKDSARRASAPLHAALAAVLALALVAPALAARPAHLPGPGRGDLQGELRGEIQGRLPPGDQGPQERPQQHHEHHVDRRRPHDGRLRGVSGFRCRKRGPWVSYFVYSTAEGIASFCVDCGEAMLPMHLVVRGCSSSTSPARGPISPRCTRRPPTSRSR